MILNANLSVNYLMPPFVFILAVVYSLYAPYKCTQGSHFGHICGKPVLKLLPLVHIYPFCHENLIFIFQNFVTSGS